MARNIDLIIGCGCYRSSLGGGPTMTSGCSARNIVASAVRT